jgi:hypothetical protein
MFSFFQCKYYFIIDSLLFLVLFALVLDRVEVIAVIHN